jgi:probable rRNA maturation factor
VREIEVVGAPEGPEVERYVAATLDRLSVVSCHVAVEFVDEPRMRDLNLEFRGQDEPTDVISFPIDGEAFAIGDVPFSDEHPLELGDVVICAPQTEDVEEATVHGVLHLCGYDHETDDGEMLALQDEIVGAVRG